MNKFSLGLALLLVIISELMLTYHVGCQFLGLGRVATLESILLGVLVAVTGLLSTLYSVCAED